MGFYSVNTYMYMIMKEQRNNYDYHKLEIT